MKRNIKNPNFLPKWLLRVQQQSWEPEILISGIVLFVLFQLPEKADYFGDYLMKFSYAVFSSGTLSLSIVAVIKIAIYWLIAGFSAHLFFRSLWVAFIGLSYVYPKGIKLEQLKYDKLYVGLVKRKESFEQTINKLEALCSSMFALSFLLFMLIIGVLSFIFFLLIILVPLSIYSPNNIIFKFLDRVINIPALVFFFDFLTLGLLKRIPIISKIYYPFYRIMSVLTLSFLYRNLYYHFISNHNKLKIAFFIFLFFSISIMMNASIRNNLSLFNAIELGEVKSSSMLLNQEHYEDKTNSNFIRSLRIESDVIKEPLLRVFIAHTSVNEEYGMKNTCLLPDSVSLKEVVTDQSKLACLNDFYKLGINDSIYISDYLFTYHPETKQPGLIAYLDISYLNKGLNTLKLYYRNSTESADSIPFLEKSNVKFYKTL